MTLRAKRRVYLVLGWFFIVLGILGVVLPILQGLLFLLIGLVLLSKASPRARLFKMKLKRRYPKYGAQFDKAEVRAAAFLHRTEARIAEIFKGRWLRRWFGRG